MASGFFRFGSDRTRPMPSRSRWRGQKFQRPLTHDLLVSVIRGLRADVVKAIISELKDNTFYATVL